jgi:tetrapyrrole methylase family protein/MazG family protein
MEQGAVDRLFDLIRVLRGENGCPWDREQTVEDILSDLVEEAYELQRARANSSPEEVFEETGDVLFVLVFAVALLHEKDPSFTIERIAEHAHAKIKRRHPHVFGGEEAKDSRESLAHWDRIKAEEKSERHGERPPLSEVPANLSPIRRAEKIQRIAAKSGFDWPDAAGIVAKIREETAEVEALLGTGRETELAEEVGDLYFSVTNLSRFLDIDGEASLTRANAKFVARYRAMAEIARRDGHRIEDLTLEQMDRYWEEAKKRG